MNIIVLPKRKHNFIKVVGIVKVGDIDGTSNLLSHDTFRLVVSSLLALRTAKRPRALGTPAARTKVEAVKGRCQKCHQ